MLACHCTPQTEDKCEGEHRGEHVTRNKVVDAVWREREQRASGRNKSRSMNAEVNKFPK